MVLASVCNMIESITDLNHYIDRVDFVIVAKLCIRSGNRSGYNNVNCVLGVISGHGNTTLTVYLCIMSGIRSI